MNLRKYARGMPCQIRLEGICNRDPETTVLCHWPSGGMGTKSPDVLGAWGCSSCHAAVDRREHPHLEREFVRLALAEGILRTQRALIAAGILKW